MSENPYAGYPSERRRDDFGLEEPQRMSILAVLSLVCAVVCCVPGMGILAFVFGAVALAGISKSQGRVTGKPLAGVGMALGLIATVIWMAIAIGGAQAWRTYTTQMVGGTSQMMQTMSDGDIGGVRLHLLEPATAELTDEDIAAFAAIVRRDFGAFVGAPTGISEMMEGFASAYGRGGVRSGGSSQEPAIPIAVNFDNGSSVVHIVIDADSFSSSKIRVEDIFVVLKNGKALTLRKDGPASAAAIGMGFDPVHASELGATESAPAEAPAIPGNPPTPEAPADDAAPM